MQPGQAVRISTGAMVPPGADAVVQVEDTKLVKASPNGEEEEVVFISKFPTPGQDIRFDFFYWIKKVGKKVPSYFFIIKFNFFQNAF